MKLSNFTVRQALLRVQGSLTLDAVTIETASVANAGFATITQSLFHYTGATSNISNSGTIEIRDTSVVDNLRTDDFKRGSLGAVNNSGTMLLGRCLIANNQGGGNGVGGIRNSGSLTVKNTTIGSNSGSHFGVGAIANDNDSPDSVLLINSTIVGNGSGNLGVGGISGTATLRNSIVSANFADDRGSDCGSAAFTSQGYNHVLGERPGT